MKIIVFITIVFLLSPFDPAYSEGESEHKTIDEINELLELNYDDPKVVRITTGNLYLKCAAFFYALSISVEDTRPKVSKLHNDTGNWYKIIGMSIIAEQGKPVSSSETYADAYIETYQIDSISKYSESDYEIKYKECTNPDFREQGKKIISDLERQSP